MLERTAAADATTPGEVEVLTRRVAAVIREIETVKQERAGAAAWEARARLLTVHAERRAARSRPQ